MPAYKEVLEYDDAIHNLDFLKVPRFSFPVPVVDSPREGRAPALSLAFPPKTIISISSFALEKNFELDL